MLKWRDMSTRGLFSVSYHYENPSSLAHQHTTCSPHDIAEKLLISVLNNNNLSLTQTIPDVCLNCNSDYYFIIKVVVIMYVNVLLISTVNYMSGI